MKNIIIGVFQFLYFISFFLMVIAGGIFGDRFFENNGFLIGAMAAFAVGALFFGPVFLLLLINDNIVALRKHFEE